MNAYSMGLRERAVPPRWSTGRCGDTDTPSSLLDEQVSLPRGGQQDMIRRPNPVACRVEPDLAFTRRQRAVDLDLSAPSTDPEFGSNRPGLLAGTLDDEPEAYLRLIANPFLACTYVVLWLVLLYHTLVGVFVGPLSPILVVILIAGLGLVPMLIRYQCLDCGGGGRLARWRKHVCYVSIARRDVGRRRRFRGPTPPIQVLIWFWAVIALVLAFNALALTAILQ